jgi:hypothetical protein
LFGRRIEGDPPAYSTDELAAERLRERIEACGIIRCTFERWEGAWYCIWWSIREGAPKERIASGSGDTRALAFCRASVNLPSWVVPVELLGPVQAGEPRACASCGSEERMRGRARAVRLCNVCSWRAGKTLPDRRMG